MHRPYVSFCIFPFSLRWIFAIVEREWMVRWTDAVILLRFTNYNLRSWLIDVISFPYCCDVSTSAVSESRKAAVLKKVPVVWGRKSAEGEPDSHRHAAPQAPSMPHPELSLLCSNVTLIMWPSRLVHSNCFTLLVQTGCQKMKHIKSMFKKKTL